MLWEKKRDGAVGFKWFVVYSNAIQNGLDKLSKYYNKFDKKPAYILALSQLSIHTITLLDYY